MLLILVSGCASRSEETIKIGAILPMTGGFAIYGSDEQKGAELAVEEINNAGGIKGKNVEMVFEDSAGENVKALNAFQKLTDVDKIGIIITATSWISNTIYEKAKERDVVQVVVASAAFARSSQDKAIRFTVDVRDEGKFLAAFLKEFERIGIIHLNNDYGSGWAKQLSEELGERIIGVEKYEPTDADMSTQLIKLGAKSPDAIVMVSTGKDGFLIAKKIKELDIKTQLIGTRPIQTRDLLQEPVLVEGLIYSYPTYDATHPFMNEYKNKYNEEPSVFAAETYDAVMSVKSALDECGDDKKCIADWFTSQEYNGALGHVTFDEKKDAQYAFSLKQIKKGKFVIFEENEV